MGILLDKAEQQRHALCWAIASAIWTMAVMHLAAPVAAVQHQRCFGHKCIIDHKTLVVMSIGTIHRPKYQTAQAHTWGSRLSVVFYDEDQTNFCVLCEQSLFDASPRRWLETNHPMSPWPFFEKNEGWWCAQKRVLQAVKHLFTEVLKDRNEWPQNLLVVDDDCWVNPLVLKGQLATLDPDVPSFMGFFNDIHELGGGAGWLINRPVIDALFEAPAKSYMVNSLAGTHLEQSSGPPPHLGFGTVLTACIARQNGHDWCFYHSDWAAIACMRAAAVDLKEVHSPIFSQCCEDADCHETFFTEFNETLDLATCHYSRPHRQYELYAQFLKLPQ